MYHEAMSPHGVWHTQNKSNKVMRWLLARGACQGVARNPCTFAGCLQQMQARPTLASRKAQALVVLQSASPDRLRVMRPKFLSCASMADCTACSCFDFSSFICKP